MYGYVLIILLENCLTSINIYTFLKKLLYKFLNVKINLLLSVVSLGK